MPMLLSAIAKAAGFAISADELKKAQSEISEEELEGVAGGTIIRTICRDRAISMAVC